MFRILFLLCAGMGLGFLLRGHSVTRKTGQGVHLTICALLFVFGSSIGSDASLMERFGSYGGQAVVIALLTTAGSLLAGVVAQRLIFGKGGRK